MEAHALDRREASVDNKPRGSRFRVLQEATAPCCDAVALAASVPLQSFLAACRTHSAPYRVCGRRLCAWLLPPDMWHALRPLVPLRHFRGCRFVLASVMRDGDRMRLKPCVLAMFIMLGTMSPVIRFP